MESNPRELRRGIVSLELGSLRTPAVSNELYQTGLDFLKSYRALCVLSVRMRRHEWLLKPKFHVVWQQRSLACLN